MTEPSSMDNYTSPSSATNGDLAKMARELLGDKGTARQVHMRLNQLGLRLRELRGT